MATRCIYDIPSAAFTYSYQLPGRLWLYPEIGTLHPMFLEPRHYWGLSENPII